MININKKLKTLLLKNCVTNKKTCPFNWKVSFGNTKYDGVRNKQVKLEISRARSCLISVCPGQIRIYCGENYHERHMSVALPV